MVTRRRIGMGDNGKELREEQGIFFVDKVVANAQRVFFLRQILHCPKAVCVFEVVMSNQQVMCGRLLC